jgi:hypothetical protein
MKKVKTATQASRVTYATAFSAPKDKTRSLTRLGSPSDGKATSIHRSGRYNLDRGSPVRIVIFTAAAPFLFAASAFAQQATVQQPVVQTFGVGTTVSVPDRGSALLGGVNSGRAARSVNGPFRTSTSLGRETQGGTASVGVYIHDLRAMDDALLATAAAAIPTNPWERKLAERRGASSNSSDVRDAPPPSRAGEFEALAQRAEQRSKPAVALTYWRLAAKEGSAIAHEKLAEKPARSSAVAKKER